jgi:hypothetical protein
MGRTTLWINNFNRLTTIRIRVELRGQIPQAQAVILANASTDPPVLDWYDHAPCEVVRLDTNPGRPVVRRRRRRDQRRFLCRD